MVPAKDFKRRMVVEIDGAPHMIEQIQVQTPSARGAATLYKIKARNLKTKTRVEKSYRGTDVLSESSFERRPIQFLYRDADGVPLHGLGRLQPVLALRSTTWTTSRRS